MVMCKPAMLIAMTAVLCYAAAAAPTRGTISEISSFSIPKSPSGMFFHKDQALLYILCGTQTNGEHYLYVYTTGGSEKCLITIPQTVGMSRVDGFSIVGSKAYIVDSQGPIYASMAGALGGSVYEVDWTNPCGCSAGATCTSTTASWSPTVTKTWSLVATDASIGDGGGVDNDFRNSGIVVVGDYWYGVNGVHPVGGSLTQSYPKSLVKVAMSATTKDAGNAVAASKWSFTASTIGHDVDMEGLTCGADECADSIYIGDEYNYIYKLDLSTGEISTEWDLNSIVGSVPADKGIESLTYASTTGYFYAGIQETAKIHVVSLSNTESTISNDDDGATTDTNTNSDGSCTITSDYPVCSAPTVSTQRVRKEIRALTTAEWDKVVAAMWVMKTETLTSGVAKYGSAFKPYDYFPAKHAVATTDTRGDQAHNGAHFMTWHGAFVLEFENALLAVDPTIPALPYWDQTISSPSVFTDAYFGADPGAETAYQVTTGKFANWPVEDAFDITDYADWIVDDSTVAFTGNGGWLRGANNELTNAFSTRYGSEAAWTAMAPTSDAWWACTTDDANEDWNDWYACIEAASPSIHSGPHGAIGGRSGNNRGDFEDTVTSPNAPIFMFHHANMDRSKMWWMLKNIEDKCTYYGFPLTNAATITPGGGGGGGGMAPPGGGPPARRSFVGAHLNDVVASAWGFTREDLGFADGLAPAGQLTHADLIGWMAPHTAAYTYDTHADCVANAANCHPVQGVVTLGETATEDEDGDGGQPDGDTREGGDDAASASLPGSANLTRTLAVLILPLLFAIVRR